MTSNSSAPVLVTGASGYIGGRLVGHLLERGLSVRCLARSPAKLADRPWTGHPQLEVVGGDAGDSQSLHRALHGVKSAFYLVHSMLAAGADYGAEDRRIAQTFAEVAAAEGVEHILYLGGLGETGQGLSEHLSSRREVEELLASTGVPVTVLRAAMILGSGSASFEILRYLTERLPVMVTPRWVGTRCQPIAVRNVLEYLVAALDAPAVRGQTLDIGGPDVRTYEELMQLMAEVRGLPPRRIFRVPLLTPRLSARWIHLVTPVSARIARPLAEGLRNEVVCRDDRAQELMPIQLLSAREAMELALANLEASRVETSWSNAGPIPGDPDWSGGKVFVDAWRVGIASGPDEVWRAVLRIGGGNGWYAADWLWRLRGWMDQVVGGPGLRRGRRDKESVRYGEALDFWRVVGLEPGRWLALRAEMKLPGAAQLEFRLVPDPDDPEATELVQTARFIPRGLMGLAYWYAVLPFHAYVFRGMLKGIRKEAQVKSGRRLAPLAAKVRRVQPAEAG
jgi:uncharacterized protein YbjT (DUF2867 family)